MTRKADAIRAAGASPAVQMGGRSWEQKSPGAEKLHEGDKFNMTEEQIKDLEKAEAVLTRIYWEMVDNHQDARQARRLDTILGKLDVLKKLN